MHVNHSRFRPCLVLFALLALAAASFAAIRPAATSGFIFTMNNNATANRVMMFTRNADGTLVLLGTFDTRGKGTGADLASQGALVVTPSHKFLYVCDAGSSEITAFSITATGLTFINKVGSGGIQPISLAVFGNVVYALNAGGTPNITGFRAGANGSLSAIAGATQNITSTNPLPAQVSFSSDGKQLLVAERGTSQFDVYAINASGQPGPALLQPSSGAGPFGFGVAGSRVVVSEVSLSSASSYLLGATGTLTPVTSALQDFGKAACWVVITGGSTNYAYITNTSSNSISGFRLTQAGALSLLNANGITFQLPTPSKPLDMALDSSSSYLYVLNQSGGNITGFRINSTGSLTQITRVGGIPTTGTYGLAGY